MSTTLSTATTSSDQDRPELRQAIEEIVESGVLGVQLLVTDERGEWVGSAGARELGSGAGPLTDGHFRIGSSTKSFVAGSVLLLVAEGRIELDAPAAQYLPAFGLDGRITVRMLLQHTSGVFSHTGELLADGTVVPGVAWQGKAWVDDRFRTYRPEELVRLSLSKEPRFAPGEGWSYSNTNYVLARLVIEEVTGRSFAEELQRLILGPLGMTGTVAPGASPELPSPTTTATTATRTAGRSGRSTSPGTTPPGSRPAAT